MALLFPWATKEYLLWQMSIGQIVLYHNLAIEMKYGGDKDAPAGGGKPVSNYQQIKAARDEARVLKQDQETRDALDRSDNAKAQYREKYGDV
jgi:hypothetical protein